MKTVIAILVLSLAFISCEKEPVTLEFNVSDYVGTWKGTDFYDEEIILIIDSVDVVDLLPYSKKPSGNVSIRQDKYSELTPEYWELEVQNTISYNFEGEATKHESKRIYRGWLTDPLTMEFQQMFLQSKKNGAITNLEEEPGRVVTLIKEQ